MGAFSPFSAVHKMACSPAVLHILFLPFFFSVGQHRRDSSGDVVRASEKSVGEAVACRLIAPICIWLFLLCLGNVQMGIGLLPCNWGRTSTSPTRKGVASSLSSLMQKLQQIIKSRVWENPRGGSETSAPGRPRAQKGNQKAGKQYSFFGVKMGTMSDFLCFC